MLYFTYESSTCMPSIENLRLSLWGEFNVRFIICESPEHGPTSTYSRHDKIDYILVQDKLDLFIIYLIFLGNWLFFPYFWNMKRHNFYMDRNVSCPIVGCGAQLNSLDDFEDHYHARHTASCSVCSRVYPTSRLLSIHVSEAHDSFFQAKVARGFAMVILNLLKHVLPTLCTGCLCMCVSGAIVHILF